VVTFFKKLAGRPPAAVYFDDKSVPNIIAFNTLTMIPPGNENNKSRGVQSLL